MTTPERFEFEGRQLTVSEVVALIPCLSETTIRAHLRKGSKSRQEILSYDPNQARIAGGRAAARRARATGKMLNLRNWSERPRAKQVTE